MGAFLVYYTCDTYSPDQHYRTEELVMLSKEKNWHMCTTTLWYGSCFLRAWGCWKITSANVRICFVWKQIQCALLLLPASTTSERKFDWCNHAWPVTPCKMYGPTMSVMHLFRGQPWMDLGSSSRQITWHMGIPVQRTCYSMEGKMPFKESRTSVIHESRQPWVRWPCALSIQWS
jgi:hypothetical protein